MGYDLEPFWNDAARSLHDQPDQLKRRASASHMEIDPKLLDKESGSLLIKDYVVSLQGCNCRDFAIRRLPCKHMYRLADELDVFDLGVEQRYGDRYPDHDNVWVGEAAALSPESQVLYRDILRLHMNGHLPNNPGLSRDPRIQELLKSGLIEIGRSSRQIISAPYSFWRPMVSILDSIGVAYVKTPRLGRRADLLISDSGADAPHFISITIPAVLGCYDSTVYAFLNKLAGATAGDIDST